MGAAAAAIDDSGGSAGDVVDAAGAADDSRWSVGVLRVREEMRKRGMIRWWFWGGCEGLVARWLGGAGWGADWSEKLGSPCDDLWRDSHSNHLLSGWC